MPEPNSVLGPSAHTLYRGWIVSSPFLHLWVAEFPISSSESRFLSAASQDLLHELIDLEPDPKGRAGITEPWLVTLDDTYFGDRHPGTVYAELLDFSSPLISQRVILAPAHVTDSAVAWWVEYYADRQMYDLAGRFTILSIWQSWVVEDRADGTVYSAIGSLVDVLRLVYKVHPHVFKVFPCPAKVVCASCGYAATVDEATGVALDLKAERTRCSNAPVNIYIWDHRHMGCSASKIPSGPMMGYTAYCRSCYRRAVEAVVAS